MVDKEGGGRRKRRRTKERDEDGMLCRNGVAHSRGQTGCENQTIRNLKWMKGKIEKDYMWY